MKKYPFYFMVYFVWALLLTVFLVCGFSCLNQKVDNYRDLHKRMKALEVLHDL